MAALQVALIGCGAIGRVQAKALLALPEYQLVALVNRHRDKAEALANELGLKLPIFTSADELYAHVTCDVVTICLPPAQHHVAVLQALVAGCHVMVEKPMALSVAQCQEMVLAAQNAHRYLGVICQNRWKDANFRLKALLDSGKLGPILGGELRSLWWRGGNYYDPAWRGTWQVEGGGCLMSHAVHQLDLLLWLIGKPQAVSAQMRNVAHDNSQCEDYVTANFDYGSFNINFICSLVHQHEEQGLYLDTVNASLDAGGIHCLQALPNGYPQNNDSKKAQLQAIVDALAPLPLSGHAAQLRHFAQVINGTAWPCGTGDEGMAAIELIAALYKAAVTQSVVSLPLASDDPFCHHETRVPLMPHFHEKKVSLATTPSLTISL